MDFFLGLYNSASNFVSNLYNTSSRLVSEYFRQEEEINNIFRLDEAEIFHEAQNNNEENYDQGEEEIIKYIDDDDEYIDNSIRDPNEFKFCMRIFKHEEKYSNYIYFSDPDFGSLKNIVKSEKLIADIESVKTVPYYYPSGITGPIYWKDKFEFNNKLVVTIPTYENSKFMSYSNDYTFDKRDRFKANISNFDRLVNKTGEVMQKIIDGPNLGQGTKYYVVIEYDLVETVDMEITEEDIAAVREDINYVPKDAKPSIKSLKIFTEYNPEVSMVMGSIINNLAYTVFEYASKDKERGVFVTNIKATKSVPKITRIFGLKKYGKHISIVNREEFTGLRIEKQEYLIIDTDTKFNCAFVSVAIGKYFIKKSNRVISNEDRCEVGREFKRLIISRLEKISKNDIISDILDKKIDESIFETISNITNTTINIMDDTCKIIRTIKPDSNIYKSNDLHCEVNIILTDGHAKPAINMKLLNKQFVSNLVESTKEKEEKIARFPMKEREKVFDGKIIAFDLESLAKGELKRDEQDREIKRSTVGYCAGHYYEEDGKEIFIQFYGLDVSIREYVKHIIVNIKIYNGYTFYAHNGGKFDVKILLPYFFEYKDIIYNNKEIIDQDGCLTGFAIHFKCYVIHFKDSYKLMQSALREMAEDLNIETAKGDIDHDKVNEKNYMSMEAQIRAYHKDDCKSLYQCLMLIAKDTFEDQGINITNCLTGATLSKNNFFTNYNKPEYNLCSLDNIRDKYCRSSYFGGRTECFVIGVVGKRYKYDIASSYPSCCREILPTAPIESVTGLNGEEMINPVTKTIDLRGKSIKESLDIMEYGVITCYVRGTQEMLKDKDTNIYRLPGLGVYKDGKFLFPYIDEPLLMRLTRVDIEQGLKYGYEFTPVDCMPFIGNYPFKNVCEELYNKRLEYKKEGMTARAAMTKIIVNSMYGWPGYNKYNKKSIRIESAKSENWLISWNRNELSEINFYDNHTVYRTVSNCEGVKTNVLISSYISSYARWKIYDIICEFGKKGEVDYGDTDSIVTNVDIFEHEDLMRKYMWNKETDKPDIYGECLGNLKSEYGILITKDNKYTANYADNIRIAGLKMYSENISSKKINIDSPLCDDKYKKHFKKEKIAKDNTSFHLKGYKIPRKFVPQENSKHLKEEKDYSQISVDFDKLMAGEEISQEVLQFSMNRNNIMKNEGMVQRRILKKFTSQYTKGELIPVSDTLAYVIPMTL